MRLAFADGFDLWRVDGVDLLAAVSALLIMHALGEIQLWAEDFIENQIVCNLTSDFADDPAEIGLEAALFTTRVLGLFGVRGSLMFHQRLLV